MQDLNSQLLEHFRKPRHAGLLGGMSRVPGSGCGRAAGSGVEVEFSILMGDGGRVEGIGWECLGCPQTIACCSWAAERLRQRGVTMLPSALEMQQGLDLAPDALSRALVVEDALRAALAAARGTNAGNEVT